MTHDDQSRIRTGKTSRAHRSRVARLCSVPGKTEVRLQPCVGRRDSRDPIGEQGGLNLYEYALDNPIGRIDPLGLWPQWLDNLLFPKPGLPGVKCVCKDLCQLLKGIGNGQDILSNALATGGFNNLGDLLNIVVRNGGQIVGSRNTVISGGVTAAGQALPIGQQNLINYFENDRAFNNANTHPSVMTGLGSGGGATYAQLWAEAEIDRLGRAVAELKKEIERRKCKCD